MRKTKKKQIEDMLAVLDKAQDAIKKGLATGNSEIALSLLEQCQDSAIQIGGMIEESQGENFVTISLLENYCEQIYQTYELIRQNRPINAGKEHKNLRKRLIAIENSVKYDIPVNITALFLPYKASMWDSLESVWRAADKDPNCDVYVVPIPYFDKNPDGSFGEMHYEGNEYPEYVPVTSWTEYDIASEHPDMIFIHNPYDEFNYVTSVPPAYYSKELKKLTDMLVYIPYYVLNNIDPADKQSIESKEHFCTVPAVVYADKVIVQSKEWRQVYIDVMTRMMGDDTRQVWEKKILGLGSPKMDKVIATRRDDLDIPEEWRRIIERPDGSRKKIIFYNTSVTALLKHSEKMLEKMEYVFQILKENQDDIVLLWRPHPLIKATIMSMRPQLWVKYERVVKVYIEEGWGIYDDTADVNRAIAISDAYYGDRSSLVQMYEKTGKPIMIQNVNITSQVVHPDIGLAAVKKIDKEKVRLQYRSSVRIENKIYFSELFLNGLFELDLRDFSVKFLGRFSEERSDRSLLHTGSAIHYKSKIYFFPHCSRKIHYYDLTTKKGGVINLPISDEEEFVTISTVQRGNEIWLFPGDLSKNIFILNMEDLSIVNAKKLKELLIGYGPTKGWVDIVERDKVYTYCADKAVLLEIDLRKNQVKEQMLPTQNINITLLNYHDGIFYFIDDVLEDLYEWNGTELVRFHIENVEKITVKGNSLTNCCFINDEVYLIPWSSKYVMKVERDEGKVKKAFDYPEDFRYIDYWVNTYHVGLMVSGEVIGGEIWFHPCGSNQMLIYNVETEEVTGKKIEIDLTDIFSFEGVICEDKWKELQSFCRVIRNFDADNTTTENQCGEKIYRTVSE